ALVLRAPFERALVVGGELALPPLLDAEAPRDGVEPGGERRLSTELAHAASHREERVLEDVLGVLRIAAHGEPIAVDLRLVTHEEILERPLIPLSSSFQKRGA